MLIRTAAALAAVTITVVACGGPDHPKPPHHTPLGPNAQRPTPASIHLVTRDANGQRLKLNVNCGSGEPIKQCAHIAQHLIKQAEHLPSNQVTNRESSQNSNSRQMGNTNDQKSKD